MTKQALYRHFDAAGRLLYVGITMCPFTRTRQHGMAAPWFDDVVRVEIERFDTRSQAETAEYAAIRTERPIHNQTFNRKPRHEGDAIFVVDANLKRLPVTIDVTRAIRPRKQRRPLTREQLAEQRQANVLERVAVRQARKDY